MSESKKKYFTEGFADEATELMEIDNYEFYVDVDNLPPLPFQVLDNKILLDGAVVPTKTKKALSLAELEFAERRVDKYVEEEKKVRKIMKRRAPKRPRRRRRSDSDSSDDEDVIALLQQAQLNVEAHRPMISLQENVAPAIVVTSPTPEPAFNMNGDFGDENVPVHLAYQSNLQEMNSQCKLFVVISF